MSPRHETKAVSPSRAGVLNLEAITEAERAAADLSNIRSFLVMWNGSLVSENYYGDTTAATRQHVRSITKSMVSALVGIAIDKGLIHSVNDKVLDYVPELKSQDNDIRKQHITIRHLLTKIGRAH